MASEPNEQQARAIQSFDKDLLVSAGAGTGKTSVLTEKYLCLLKEGRAEVGQLVAITFTNKAAAEMRLRIQYGIEALLSQTSDPQAVAYWQNQLQKLEIARICTFHSLCLGLIREHPMEAGIPPRANILNDGEEHLYLNQAIAEVFTRFQQEESEEARVFGRLLAEHGWETLLKGCRQVYQSIRESGQALAAIIGRTEENLSHWPTDHEEDFFQLRQEIDAFLEDSRKLKLTPRALEILASFREKWPGLKAALTRSAILEDVVLALQEIRKGLPLTLPVALKEGVTEIRERIDKLSQMILDSEALTRLPVYKRLLSEIDRCYHDLKLKAGFLDFTDQQILARDMLLNHPGLAEDLRRGIRYILVDEFQDTNNLQLDLIRQLVGEDYDGGRWMAVGDVKQSIYRFRGAEAGVIVQLRRQFEAGGGAVIPLAINYRSQEPVIRYVNQLAAFLFEGEHFVYEPLIATQTGATAGIEFLIYEEDDIAGQARRVAGRINRLLRESEATSEPLSYGDVAILFRTGRAMTAFQNALREAKIPYHLSGGSDFYQRPEITDQLNLLRLVEQAYDGVALLALLKSPYVGLRDEELLRLENGQTLIERFYAADLEKYWGNTWTGRRLIAFRNLLLNLQYHREALTIAEMLQWALNRSDYLDLCWVFSDASQRVANLEKLLTKAAEFSSRGFFNPTAFLTYIEDLASVDALEAEAPTQGEASNVVRLMTIHRSKGLEFPVVILPDLDRRFHGGRQQPLSFHKEVGLGFKLYFGTDEVGETSVWAAIKERERREELSELKRLLYVALTRAKNRLIMAGSGASDAKGATLETANSWMKWFQIIHPFPVAEGYFEFAGLSIAVTRELPPAEMSGPVEERIFEADEDLKTEVKSRPEETGRGEVAATRSAPSLQPFTLKPTGIMAFRDCPRRFFYRYVLKMAEPAKARVYQGSEDDGELGTEIGTFFHQAVRLRTREWPGRMWERFMARFPSTDREKLTAAVIRMWDHFAASEFATYEACWDEVPFVIKLGPDIRVEGRFDRLLRTVGGELVLVDYKTHRLPAEAVPVIAARYHWQVRLYALAVEMLWGRRPDRAVIYFPYPDVRSEVTLDEAEFERLREEVERMVEFITAHSRPAEYPGKPDCPGCGLREYCKRA